MLRRIVWTLGIVAVATSPAVGKTIKPANVPITGPSCKHDLEPTAHTFESSKGDEIQWTVSVNGGKDGCQTTQKVLLCAFDKGGKKQRPFHTCSSTPKTGRDMGVAFEVSPGETEQLLCRVKKVTAKKSFNLRAFVGSEVTGNACPNKEPKDSHPHGEHFPLTHVLDTEIFP